MSRSVPLGLQSSIQEKGSFGKGLGGMDCTIKSRSESNVWQVNDVGAQCKESVYIRPKSTLHELHEPCLEAGNRSGVHPLIGHVPIDANCQLVQFLDVEVISLRLAHYFSHIIIESWNNRDVKT